MADLGQLRLRRSPLNHNTAGGSDFPIDYPRGPARDSSLAANPASAWRPLPENAKHMPGASPGFEWSREAAAAFSRGRKPMEYGTPLPEPRRRRQQSFLVFNPKQARLRPAVRIIRGKTADRKTNHEWTRINTNRPEDGWTSFNGKRRQNASALLSRWCDHVMGGSPPGSAGVPPAQILPQLRPSPPPESTGSGALPLLRPGPCGSRRQGGRLQHRRETERQPKGQHAGGTPALPGVSSRW